MPNLEQEVTLTVSDRRTVGSDLPAVIVQAPEVEIGMSLIDALVKFPWQVRATKDEIWPVIDLSQVNINPNPPNRFFSILRAIADRFRWKGQRLAIVVTGEKARHMLYGQLERSNLHGWIRLCSNEKEALTLE